MQPNDDPLRRKPPPAQPPAVPRRVADPLYSRPEHVVWPPPDARPVPVHATHAPPPAHAEPAETAAAPTSDAGAAGQHGAAPADRK